MPIIRDTMILDDVVIRKLRHQKVLVMSNAIMQLVANAQQVLKCADKDDERIIYLRDTLQNIGMLAIMVNKSENEYEY